MVQLRLLLREELVDIPTHGRHLVELLQLLRLQLLMDWGVLSPVVTDAMIPDNDPITPRPNRGAR